MKKLISIFIVCAFASIFVQAQNIAQPSLTPNEPTAAQKLVLREGARLHDAKMYDRAIEKYDQVLRECPTCVMAIYEKTLSLYYKKDFDEMLKLAFEGLKYKSAEIPLFYGLIANVYDDRGNSEKAIDIYKQGIAALEKGGAEYATYLSSLHFNLGITRFRRKQPKEAREHFKKSAELNPRYASPNYLLAQLFNGAGYKIPAMLAAARLISLELNTERSRNSALIFRQIIGGNSKSENGNTTIFLNLDAPKDEGDFMAFDLILGTLTAVGDDADKNKDEIEKLAGAIDTVSGLLADDKKLANTFVGRTYLPFMTQVKSRGYTKVFAAMILWQSGDQKAVEWLKTNEALANEFFNWSKNFK